MIDDCIHRVWVYVFEMIDLLEGIHRELPITVQIEVIARYEFQFVGLKVL